MNKEITDSVTLTTSQYRPFTITADMLDTNWFSAPSIWNTNTGTISIVESESEKLKQENIKLEKENVQLQQVIKELRREIETLKKEKK